MDRVSGVRRYRLATEERVGAALGFGMTPLVVLGLVTGETPPDGVAIACYVLFALMVMAVLAAAAVSGTDVTDEHVDARFFWRRRRVPWADVEKLAIEPVPRLRPDRGVVAYLRGGERVPLPRVDGTVVEREHGYSLDDEMKVLRAAWAPHATGA